MAIASPSNGRNAMDFIHVAVRGGSCLVRTATVLTRVQIRRVPIPPVMFAVCLLILPVMFFGFTEELCQLGNIDGFRIYFPLASSGARCHLLQEPAVPVWILKGRKYEVAAPLRIAPADPWVVHGIVEGEAGV